MSSASTPALPGLETRPGGARYAVLDQGAHVLAWQPPGAREVLWTSGSSRFTPGFAVRGGIPVVFPWFGSGPDGDRSPAHGYARTSTWDRVSVLEAGDRLTVEYRLPAPSDQPFPSAGLIASFGPEQLEVTLDFTNHTSQAVTVEAALHTYLAVGDIRTVSLDGLDGVSYRDSVPGADSGPKVQQGPVRFGAETDRLYAHTGAVVLHDPTWDRAITVAKQGSGTTVVWNPWVAKAAAMADFGDDEWQTMVCIEAAAVRDTAITLEPGASHRLGQVITLG